ncbi:MAG: carboxypeptidase M32, partial [Bacilli bacterium]|nr:carboxypeptidase M32 [Bacilli bacterium]
DDGASLAIHESQSRFYENMISRNENYLNYIYPKVVELFPNQMKDVTPHEFYLAANAVSPSFIRTEADELTYCLHIMVRYELEKDLMSGKLKVKDIPTAWNKKYQEYLGITPPTDTLGCLQDTHWYGGSIGYFFSYALGNAYSGQILHAMQQDINIDEELKKGNLKVIKDWLYEHVHQYGALYAPQELIKLATKEEFTPKYYCDYLEKKFKIIYQL